MTISLATHDMQTFDALPDRIRRALASADYPHDPREIAERLAAGRRPDVIARALEKRSTAP